MAESNEMSKSINLKETCRTSGQDGGIGRYTLPLHTMKRRTTTNLRTKSNQNCQKIELYGSPTTKELKKKHSSRLVGGAEWTCSKVVAGGLGGATFATGKRDRSHNPAFWHREIKPQSLLLQKSVGVAAVGESPSLTGGFIGESHRVLECAQAHPPKNQH